MKTVRQTMRTPRPTGQSVGSVVIEFAFLLIFLMLLTVGITEFGRAFWYYSALQKGARDGARCMSVVDLADTGKTVACRQLAADTANAAGVWPPLTRDGNIFLVTSTVAKPGDPPEYVQIAVRNFDIGWIWSLGEPLPAAGGGTTLHVAAAMPYMYVKPGTAP